MSKLQHVAVLIVLCGAAGVLPPVAQAEPPPVDYAHLYKLHDFFSLRAALAKSRDADSTRMLFYRAAVMSAFNQPLAADRLIDKLLQKTAGAPFERKLLEMRLENARRLSDYHSALEAANRLMKLYAQNGDKKKLGDIRNTIKLLDAIRNVPAQKVLRHGKSLVGLSTNDGPGKCIPITIGNLHPCYILDSGANYSVLIHSEATRLGLKIIPAGVQVGSSTDAKVTADMAVAPVLKLGSLEYRNVVFLVMPDSALTTRDFTIRGILGYQIFSGMGAVTTHIGQSIEIPARVSRAAVDNIALDGNDILTQVNVDGRNLVCRLDTGADRSVFYKSYYDQFSAEIDKAGTLREVRTEGAGGIRSYKAYTLPQLGLKLAGHEVQLHDVNVYTEPVVPKNYLMCNLGEDVLKSFKSYTINLQAMSLRLE